MSADEYAGLVAQLREQGMHLTNERGVYVVFRFARPDQVLRFPTLEALRLAMRAAA